MLVAVGCTYSAAWVGGRQDTAVGIAVVAPVVELIFLAVLVAVGCTCSAAWQQAAVGFDQAAVGLNPTVEGLVPNCTSRIATV